MRGRDKRPVKIEPYTRPAGGWGSMIGMRKVLAAEEPPAGGLLVELARQNNPAGLACVSCAWPKPPSPHIAEFCENGAKATMWDLTRRRCTPDFFAGHTLTDLMDWSDFDLEQTGRLTAPLRYDPARDTYVECRWEDAFAAL